MYMSWSSFNDLINSDPTLHSISSCKYPFTPSSVIWFRKLGQKCLNKKEYKSKRRILVDWCTCNSKGQWYNAGISLWFFEKEDDALHFILRWSDTSIKEYE